MTVARWLLAAGLAIAPLPVLACEHLTRQFELCSDSTPWASGRWENGGDSATLYVDGIGFEGFEEYIGSADSTSLNGAMKRLLRETAEVLTRDGHLRDSFSTAHLTIERSIATEQFQTNAPEVKVLMIAEGSTGARIALTLRAPEGTSVAEMDRLSRDYAALVRPKMGEN